MQDALRRGHAGPADAAEEALELLAGWLADQGPDLADPLTPALLAREADRSGGPAADATLDAATRTLRACRVPAPGVGLAGVAVALARVRAGRDPAPAVAHLAGLLDASTTASDAGLELAVLLRPGSGADAGSLPGLRRLGATLGAGLPGRVLPEPPLERLALASVVLGLVDEATGQRLARGWGVGAAEVARRTAAQVRARVAEQRGHARALDADRRALAWLVLGRPNT